jgi:hypothetical protein
MSLLSIPCRVIGDVSPPGADVFNGVIVVALIFGVVFLISWIFVVLNDRAASTQLPRGIYAMVTTTKIRHKCLVIFLVLILGLVFYIGNGGGDNFYMRRVRERIMMGNLAKGAAAFATGAGSSARAFPTNQGANAHAAALLLAQYGNYTDTYYYIDHDDALETGKFLPRIVASPDKNGQWQLDPDFAHFTLSVEFAANLPPNAPPATTPVVWTRGLRSDGSWAPDSPFAGNWGCVGFLDGHVDVLENGKLDRDNGTFVKYGTKTPTLNILEALPPGALVLRAEPAAGM